MARKCLVTLRKGFISVLTTVANKIFFFFRNIAHFYSETITFSLFSKVRSQISTITMAAFNTTVASFNVGYADFFTEHMKKLCNPVTVPEMPVEPLACANLPRSLTDSCINYSCLDEGENIEGTNNFVLKNGMLDLTVSRSTDFKF